LYFELSASHQEGKRITIGDFTNNGKNEIVITKSSRLIIEGGKDEEHRWRQHRYILDILSWRGRYFEVINSLISGGGNGDGGLSIFDSDGDGKNELIISGSSSYFVWEFDPEYFSGPPGMIKGIDMTGVGGFGCYAGLRIALGIVGKDVHCLVACVLATTPEWRPQEDVGRLKVFRAPIEKRPTTEELEERLVASINLPTEPLSKDKERKIAKIESIVLGDIDNDGKNEIIVNYKDGFFYIIGITNEVLVFE
ncbi:MAG: hypothetical protein Q7J55_03170, partial [bacterium]|nr:hypothetical protein [bacterium]